MTLYICIPISSINLINHIFQCNIWKTNIHQPLNSANFNIHCNNCYHFIWRDNLSILRIRLYSLQMWVYLNHIFPWFSQQVNTNHQYPLYDQQLNLGEIPNLFQSFSFSSKHTINNCVSKIGSHFHDNISL